jgi:hypothetical protein
VYGAFLETEIGLLLINKYLIMLVMVLKSSIGDIPMQKVYSPTEPDIDDVISFSYEFNPKFGCRALMEGDHFYYTDAPSTWYFIGHDSNITEEQPQTYHWN